VMTATNSKGTTTQPYRLYVLQPAQFSSANSANLMVGINRKIPITANGYPKLPSLPFATDLISTGIEIRLLNGVLPAGTLLKPAAADGSNSGGAYVSGIPTAGSEGTYVFALGAIQGVSGSSNAAQQTMTLKVMKAGDVTGDGQVNCSDVSAIKAVLNAKIGTAAYTQAAQAADVNRDGVVNVVDLAFVTSKLPAGTKCP
jgi:hypothetical protein